MRRSITTYSKRIRDPIDVIEPGGDQRDLKNPAIVETNAPQPIMVLRTDARRIPGQLNYIVEHYPVLFADRSGLVVRFESPNHRFIQCHSTQKLCVRLDSVDAAVGYRHDGGDHLVLAPFQREIG